MAAPLTLGLAGLLAGLDISRSSCVAGRRPLPDSESSPPPLDRPAVVKLLNSGKLVPMKVDLTGNNPAGDRKLLEAGSRAIPYLVIIAPDGKQVFASDAYTVEQLVSALGKVDMSH